MHVDDLFCVQHVPQGREGPYCRAEVGDHVVSLTA
jgi:hypothetical protein